jgi:predicted MFS family arabinose efflux permease
MRGGSDKGRKVRAWISFGLAVIGGAAIVATFVGGAIAGLVGFFPSWVAIAAFVGALVAMTIDLIIDGEPNRIALCTAMVLPSLARAVPGKLSDTVTQASSSAHDQVNQSLGVWLGTSSAIGIAVACVIVSLLMGRRVLAKRGDR